MSSLFKKITALIVGDDAQRSQSRDVTAKLKASFTSRDLLRLESKVGATLFGPIPKGRNREFFCLDESTWIWHEEWKDEKGVGRQTTVRYEVHPNGILKVSDGPRYQFIEGAELENFAQATKLYFEETAKTVYKRDPKTGIKFA